MEDNMREMDRKRHKLLRVLRLISYILFIFWIISLKFLIQDHISTYFDDIVTVAVIILLGIISFKSRRLKKELGIHRLEDDTILPPTDVKFEKTDDVNENIRRYKEAQKKVVEEIRAARKHIN